MPSRKRTPRRSGAGGTLLGIFIGMALGLALAVGVAFYLLRAGSPYQSGTTTAARESSKDASRVAKSDATTPDKPRFDFYKILPGGEEPKVQPKAGTDRMTAERATQPPAKQESTTVAKADTGAADKAQPKSVPDSFWLQAGSFAGEAEA